MTYKSRLSPDAVHISEVVGPGKLRTRTWASHFSVVGDVMIPSRIEMTLGSSRNVWKSSVFPIPTQSLFPTHYNELVIEKLNLLSKNTKRVWAVGRVLRDFPTPHTVSHDEWFETTGMNEYDFEQSLKVLHTLHFVKIERYSPYRRYFVAGPSVTPLEIVALE